MLNNRNQNEHNKRIRYVCYYDRVENNTLIALSAVNKLNYIFSALNSIGYSVDIISPSYCKDSRFRFLPKRVETLDNGNTLRVFSSFGGGRFAWRISHKLVIFQLFLYLFLNVKRGDLLFVYHSPALAKWMCRLKTFKKCLICGEIEEIYQNVSPMGKSHKKAEFDFINACDKYIFPTQLLNVFVNKTGKPHIIIHGTYSLPKDYKNKLFTDGRIHVVYAGTLNQQKGGAAAAAAAVHLDRNYHMHILGVGTPTEVDLIKERISEISMRTEASITYDGVLSGEDFDRFLQSCDIGLSTQDPNAIFNSTSYPSKILTYMGAGLSVVSIRIPAIVQSAVAQQIYFYDEQTPEEIANAIKKVNCKGSYERNREVIVKLDKEFTSELKIFCLSK